MAYNAASIFSISAMIGAHLAHSPSPIPFANGNLPPSTSPKPNTLLTASLIPTVPQLTISSSALDTIYCSARIFCRRSVSSGPSAVTRLYSATTLLGKIPARPSMAPKQPTCSTGNSCCPRPVKRWKWSVSMVGSSAIWACTEMSPWESLPPTMFGCAARARKVEGRILTLFDTPG